MTPNRQHRMSVRRDRLRQLPEVLANWSRKRVTVTVITAAASAVFLTAATGMIFGAGTGWAGYALVSAGSILAGFLAGSYTNAPIGAVPTFCDLRWPVMGMFGMVWAGSPREALPPVQGIVGTLALALMALALHARLEHERKVTLARRPQDSDVEVCTDCRPLFSAKLPPR